MPGLDGGDRHVLWRFGGPKRIFISVPLVSALLDEPGPTVGRKYLILPDEPEPAIEAPSPRRRKRAQSRRCREVVALDLDPVVALAVASDHKTLAPSNKRKPTASR